MNNFKEQYKYPLPEQYDLYKKMHYLMNTYLENNSFENREYMCFLAASVFLICKEYFPQFSIHINMRTKSDKSFFNNIIKEFIKSFDFPINISFDPLSTTKDISGYKIIFHDFNYSLSNKTDQSKELFSDSNISKLLNTSYNNLNFIKNVDKFLKNPIVYNSKQYFRLRKNLLERIVNLTPDTFTNERLNQPSFLELLNIAKKDYSYLVKNDDFPVIITDSQLDDLSDLLAELRFRLYDPLQFAILEKIIPVIYNHPLIKNGLKTTLKFEKHKQKPNGFEAIYYKLLSPFGHIQELQAQSNKAFYTDVRGSAYHSGIAGKLIDVDNFFELVDPNDKNKLSYYLTTLDNISADSLTSKCELPNFKTEQEKEDFFKTDVGKHYLESEKYFEMMKHIKIKDNIELKPERPPEKEYIAHQHEETNPKKIKEIYEKRKSITINTDEFLLSFALSASPFMDVCSAAHTSFTTATIHHKKLTEEFLEILRKRDSNTILRNMLIRRLDKILKNLLSLDENSIQNLSSLMKYNLKNIKAHNQMTSRLPKDISKDDIREYAKRLPELIKQKEEKASEDLVI